MRALLVLSSLLLQPAPKPAATIDMNKLPMRPEAPIVEEARAKLRQRDDAAALAKASSSETAAAQLIRARVLRTGAAYDLGKPEVASQLEDALAKADKDPLVAPWSAIERAHWMRSRNEEAAVVAGLKPLVDGGASKAVSSRAAVLFVRSLAVAEPQTLIEKRAVYEALLPSDDPDARSFFLEAVAFAYDAQKQADEATKWRLKRYLEEPVSIQTPETPPKDVVLTSEQIIARAEKLAEAHRSERVLEALKPLVDKTIGPELACRRAFAMGLAARKLRAYAEAETNLTRAVTICKDEELKRRAHYLNAKVISVRDGLRSVPVIDAFAKKYGNHSMVDDVLFWAGDIYQRRDRIKEAQGYYARIEKMSEKGDHCAEARWRLAWMDYRADKGEAARDGFKRLLTDDGCVQEVFDKARALYWLAREAEKRGDKAEALNRYSEVLSADPLEFYAQVSLARMQQLDADRAKAAAAGFTLPEGAVPPLRLGDLENDAAYKRGLALLSRGLGEEAAAELMTVGVPARQVLGSAHAQSLGEAAKNVTVAGSGATLPDSIHPRLVIALLLDRAGAKAKAEAQWRLRTEFADILSTAPTKETAPIWRAAYPLAMREHIEPAEKEAKLPPFFLQALAREESAFNEQVVSWAGAYGLTQLLLSSGRGAAQLLKPAPKLTRAEDLLDPHLNARLGGALLAQLMRKLGGSPALALAGYNAGEEVASTWWSRFQGGDFDVFAEEMTIKETRGYVKRVLRTYGVYRWMYTGAPPTIPVELTLPVRSAAN